MFKIPVPFIIFHLTMFVVNTLFQYKSHCLEDIFIFSFLASYYYYFLLVVHLYLSLQNNLL